MRKQKPVLVIDLDTPRAPRPPRDVAAAMARAAEAFRALSTFEGQLNWYGIERSLQQIVQSRESDARTSPKRYARLASEAIEDVRQCLKLPDDDPLLAGVDRADLAAAAAFRLGVLLLTYEQTRTRPWREAGGRARGQQIAAAARLHDAEVVKLYLRWQQSDYLQDDYRTPVAYIAKMTKRNRRAIERALQRLKAVNTSQPRQ